MFRMDAAKSSKLYYNYMFILVIQYRIHYMTMTRAELQILINRIEQQRETIKTIKYKLLLISLFDLNQAYPMAAEQQINSITIQNCPTSKNTLSWLLSSNATIRNTFPPMRSPRVCTNLDRGAVTERNAPGTAEPQFKVTIFSGVWMSGTLLS